MSDEVGVKHERELREQWQEGHEKVHLQSAAALSIAREEIERRLETMNEFRAQLNDERGKYVSRDMHDNDFDGLREATDARLKVLEGVKSNLEGRMWMTGAIVSAVVVLINMLLYWMGHRK